MDWGEIVKGYLGHGVLGLVSVTMLALYVRKDREVSQVHRMMTAKMSEVGDAWKAMFKELEESLRARRNHLPHQTKPALQVVPAEDEDEEG